MVAVKLHALLQPLVWVLVGEAGKENLKALVGLSVAGILGNGEGGGIAWGLVSGGGGVSGGWMKNRSSLEAIS